MKSKKNDSKLYRKMERGGYVSRSNDAPAGGVFGTRKIDSKLLRKIVSIKEQGNG
jgi:hypothetical protein